MAKPIQMIPVPRKAYEAIGAIIDLGVERVAALAKAAPKEKPPVQLRQLKRLIEDWAGAIGVADKAAIERAVFDVLLPANAVRVEHELALEEFLRVFERSVHERASDEWKEKYAARWPETLRALAPLFAPDNFLSMTIKTAELLFSQPAILQDVNLLSDIRPVYDEAGQAIQSLLLTNTLILTYARNGSSESVHVMLDLDDLARLKKLVARAERKNTAAREAALRWRVHMLTVASEESDPHEDDT